MNTPKIRGKKPPAWSDAEMAAVREHYSAGGSKAVLPFVPGRSIRAIQNQAHLMKLSAPQETWWSAQEDALLREHYATKGGAAVGQMIGRTEMAVRRRAQTLKVRGSKFHMRKPPKEPKKRAPAPTVLRKAAKVKQETPRLSGEAIITSTTRVTIAPAFVDRRFAPSGPPPRVVDSDACRDWAKVAA